MAGDDRLLQAPERRGLADLVRSAPISSSAFWKGAALRGIGRLIGCASPTGGNQKFSFLKSQKNRE